MEYWNDGPPWRDKNVTGLLLCINSVTEALALNSIKSACPGATGYGYAIVFTAYDSLTFHCHILTCQVWARGLGQGIMGSGKMWQWFIEKISLKSIPPKAGLKTGSSTFQYSIIPSFHVRGINIVPRKTGLISDNCTISEMSIAPP